MEALSQLVDKIVDSVSPEDLEATLSTLRKIFNNIIQHPNDDKYRQIKLANKTFNSKVWRYPACEELMKMSGWVVEDDHVRLRDDSHIHIVSQLLGRKETNVQHTSQFSAKKPDTEMFVPPEDETVVIVNAIRYGMGNKVKQVLSQYNTSDVRCMWLLGESPLIFSAFRARQIGVARILIEEYGIDANASDGKGSPCFLELFSGCDSSDACQSLIIEFIKEFKLHVCTGGQPLSAIHLACLLKLFTVLRYLVEKCQVPINQPISNHKVDVNGGTALHIAYGINEVEIAQYLIQHGANSDIKDSDGKKPQEYMLYSGQRVRDTTNFYSKSSNFFIKRSKIFRNFASKELYYFQQLCNSGTPAYEAVNLTLEIFPELNKEATHAQPPDLEATPTMNKLNHYITDMAPSYYAIGLELDIPNSKLKVIKSDPSLADLQEKCRKMLEVWLETDTSATWRKLCDALEEHEVGLCAVAERIKGQPVV